MNESQPLHILPDPPENLAGAALGQWYNIGNKLIEANSLTIDTLEKLTDLCFWELQKNEVMEQLKYSESIPVLEPGGGKARKPNTSVYLSNLKAIQKEIDKIRSAFGLTPIAGEKISESPFIPDIVYQNLPGSLKKCCELIDDQRKRDLFLSSSLPVLASHLTGVLTEHADGFFSPDLYTLVVDDSGTSKKMADKAAELGSTLHHNLMKKNEPGRKNLFLSAESGLDALYQNLFENGGKGLLCETKLEKLIDTEKTEWDWKQFSEIVNKAYHHQQINVKLKTGYLSIENPQFSISFSASSNQFKGIFERTGNDHFSHYALYSYDAPVTWQSGRPHYNSRNFQQKLAEASEKYYLLFRELSARKTPLYIELPDEQWQMIDETFAEKMQIIEELDLPKALHKYNTNTAIFALKMASIFTVIRKFEENPGGLANVTGITPARPDMIAALWLADTYIKHAIRLIEILPDSAALNVKGERFERFYKILPAEFETSDALEIADKLKIPSRTAKRYLNTFLENKKMVRISRGVYKKNVSI